MAREAKPWYRKQTGLWMAVTVRDKSPTVESRELTGAGVIELYLTHEGKHLGEMTLYGKMQRCFSINVRASASFRAWL